MKQLTAILFVAILAVSSAFADYASDNNVNGTANVEINVIEALTLEVNDPFQEVIDVIVGTTRDDFADVTYSIGGQAGYDITVITDVNGESDLSVEGMYSTLTWAENVPTSLNGSGEAQGYFNNIAVTGNSVGGNDTYNFNVNVYYSGI